MEYDHLKSPETATTYILELELKIESLVESLKEIQRSAKKNQILVGTLNSEKKKLEAAKRKLEDDLESFKATYNTKALFSERVSSLIKILKKQRKFSQDEEERKILEEFITVLNKANDDS